MPAKMRGLGLILCLLLLVGISEARKHLLYLSDDERPVIVITSFGYLEGGYLEVNITNLKSGTPMIEPSIGFSLDKSSSSGTSSYVEREESTRGCVLDEKNDVIEDVPRAILKIILSKDSKDPLQYELKIKERLLHGLKFYANKSQYEAVRGSPKSQSSVASTSGPTSSPTQPPTVKAGQSDGKVESESVKPSPAGEPVTITEKNSDAPAPSASSRRKRAPVPASKKGNTDAPTEEPKGYIDQEPGLHIEGNYQTGMNLSFYVHIENKEQIGLYELYFHNCHNSEKLSDSNPIKIAFTASIEEKNKDSFLSAGDLALPTMYGVMSLLFFISGIVWLRMICTTKEQVFKIHYLMAVIIFIKGLSVMFHSLDYYFIAKDGRTEAWAVIYYIVHLLKGILLIICLLLIGTGWAFIKYILSDRDKKLFMIVIPMQVMVNIAYIIMEETEEGNKSYYTWKNIVILVDVLCCGAILIPVVWSIRHLQEASQTDGKAAINLAKLELFRQFYIMVVCYLYFTRIIVYLLEITLPFQYIWIHALFSELGGLVFFSVTGYKFRPGCDNPYLKLDQYDSEEDPEEAITQSGATENITRVNKHDKDVEETDEFDVLLPKQRTSKV